MSGPAGLVGLEWATLRPMASGRKPARTVRNPVIEPLWVGRRVLARVASDGVELRDEAGLPLAGHPALQAALVEAAGGAALVLDGYLVELPPLGAALVPMGMDGVAAPSLGEVTRTFTFGRRRDRTPASPVRALGAPARSAGSADSGGSAGSGGSGGSAAAGATSPVRTLSFVTVDVLALDDESLLDVPLLERKRLLEAALTTGELARRSPHVRPPAEAWFRQWRALGFRAIAVKDANSRYVPGTASPDWTIAPIPQP